MSRESQPKLYTTCLTVAFLAIVAAAPVCAAEPLHARIDRMIAAGMDDHEKLAAPLASDAEFLRRITLDLTGMIPTAAQAREFLADQTPGKREKLIDKLLASPEYARHLQRVFDVILMQRRPAKHVSLAEWQKYLRDSFAQDKHWDQLAREILTADGTNPKLRPAARFFLDREVETNRITRDVGMVFLGMDIECSQCHDHPEVDDFLQEYYYGIQAFFVRSYLFTDKKKKVFLAEKPVGEVSFKSVFNKKGANKTKLPQVLDGKSFAEPKFKKGEEFKVKPAKGVRPVPKYSRLARLGEAITNPENKAFPRAIANRLWAVVMGRGLVHPVWYDHSDNPPSHPELLDVLAEEMTAGQYDIKRFIRELVLSKTYQRSSRRPERTEEIGEETFAQATLKPLSAEQFCWAMMQATGLVDVKRKSLGDKLTEESLHKSLVGNETTFIKLFGGQPGQPPRDFESRADQVLFLSNDKTIRSWLLPQNGNLTDRLAKLPADQPAAIAEELFLSVLTRPAGDDEIKAVAGHLAQSKEDRAGGLQELVWALVTSSEFRFNH